MRKFVSELLDSKGHRVDSVHPDDSVYRALESMADKNIGAVVVLDDDEAMVGIFSERDYARKGVLQGRIARDTPVGELMTSVVATVGPGQSIEDCMQLMTDERVRHLPVIDDGDLIGIISIGDVVNSIITRQRHMIRQLENYITGQA